MQISRLKSTWPFQALADENRLRVVRLLAKAAAPLTAGQIATALKLQPNHLSRHLHVLEVAGLTAIERRGRSHFIFLRDAHRENGALFEAVRALNNDPEVFSEDMTRLQRALGAFDEPYSV